MVPLTKSWITRLGTKATMEIPFVYKWYSVQRKCDGDPTSHQGING
jgi:hypothetical protein